MDEKPKTQRTCNAVATLALVVVALITVGAVAINAVYQHDPAATTLLATLATGALSALIVLSGGKRDGQ